MESPTIEDAITYHPCPVCGHPGTKIYNLEMKIAYRRCKNCNLAF
jgi:ssDNA-binding Zn-finger/Zn-ribbon topoisomerase 1